MADTRGRRWRRAFWVVGTLVGVACAKPTPALPVSSPRELCRDPSLSPGSFCMPVARLEQLFGMDSAKVMNVQDAPSGTSGAVKVRLSITDGQRSVVVYVKWKGAEADPDAFNNSPRRELAAYELQKLFLDPDEFVVPPTIARCVPLGDEDPRPPVFAGASCSLGVAAYWLQNVTSDDPYDADRFAADARYRHHVGNLNIFTTLGDQRDAKDSNFLVSTDPRRPRVFSIDNGLSFGQRIDNPFIQMRGRWREVFVPAIPHATVQRLRALRRPDFDALAVVAQFEIDEGRLWPVEPGPAIMPDKGVRRRGATFQLGLTRSEIDAVYRRVKMLVHRVDRGDIRAVSGG